MSRLDPNLLTALATLGLVGFAAVQILLEIVRRWASQNAAALEAQGHAWLARSFYLEATEDRETPNWYWASQVLKKADEQQEIMMAILRAAARADRHVIRLSILAYGHWIGFRHALELITRVRFTGRQPGGVTSPTDGEREMIQHFRREAEARAEEVLRALSAMGSGDAGNHVVATFRGGPLNGERRFVGEDLYLYLYQKDVFVEVSKPGFESITTPAFRQGYYRRSGPPARVFEWQGDVSPVGGSPVEAGDGSAA